MTLRSILVPLDGSPFGEHALPHALGLARRANAGLTLAHVRVPPSHFSSADVYLPVAPDEVQREIEQARAYLEDVTRRVKAAPPAVEVTATMLEGGISDALCEFIGRSKPDLVVLTTHGRGPLSRFWLGSVASDLVQRATAPLLLVRPREEPADLASDAVPRRILIPLDGSPFGEQIIPTAAAVGTLASAAYRLLRVVPPVLSSSGGGLGDLGAGSRTVADQLQAEASGYLVGLTARVPALSAASTHVAVDWPPAVAILADADASGTDLIALETRGRSGLARLLLGSVADKVVRASNVPVLLRRPDGG